MKYLEYRITRFLMIILTVLSILIFALLNIKVEDYVNTNVVKNEVNYTISLAEDIGSKEHILIFNDTRYKIKLDINESELKCGNLCYFAVIDIIVANEIGFKNEYENIKILHNDISIFSLIINNLF